SSVTGVQTCALPILINRFPTDVEVWDLRGTLVERVASEPLAEQVPIDGVRVGPRDYAWRATAPATLVWTEALDEGDTFKNVPYQDRKSGGEGRGGGM